MIKSVWFLLFFCSMTSYALPKGFVYLQDVAPDIVQEMRYATYHNFVGRPIKGYEQGQCILTKAAARQLARVQQVLEQAGYGLKVYDCYRPQMAVEDFIAWSQKPNQKAMKAEFYPKIDKKDFFKRGYVAEYSGHSRGSTVDLTVIQLPPKKQDSYHEGQVLSACYAPFGVRFRDNSIDMGTGFDCIDTRSHVMSPHISKTAHQNRMMLKAVMKKHGFRSYWKEWWHFTLRNEPYPAQYFNFPV
ncbi:MAG: M15 family metallopeptidase [Gammaproteobacteria bacterium]|nr:M15 family metallopeptidase [Gammaproteobacteria bacterium]